MVGTRGAVFRWLPDGERQLDALADEHVRDAILVAERVAKQVVPVDTGNLKRSLQTRREQPGQWVLATPVAYAADVEFGGDRRKPKPYMRPAAQAALDWLRIARRGKT